MARFVESAVLQIIDQSTGPINKVRSALRALDRTAKGIKGKDLKFNLQASSGNIAAITGQVIRLQSALTGAVAKANQLNSALRAIGGVRMPALPQQPAGPGSGGPGRSGRNRIRDYAGYYAVSRGFHTAGNITAAGGQGILEADRDRLAALQRNLPAELQKAIDEGSRDASMRFRAIPAPIINEATRAATVNLKDELRTPEMMKKLTGVLGSVLTSEFIRLGDKKQALDSANRGVKFADLAEKTKDVAKLEQFLQDLTAVANISGKDLKSDTILAGARGAKTLLATQNREGLMRLIAMLDETGQRGGNELFQFVQSMTGQNITKAAMKRQKELGLRDSKGNTIDDSLIRENTAEWMQKYLGPIFKKAGVTGDGSTEDNARIDKLAQTFGLRNTAMNYFVREMMKDEERTRAIREALRVRTDQKFNEDATSKSVALSLQAATTQFQAAVDKLTLSMQQPFANLTDQIAQKLATISKEGLSAGDTAALTAVIAGGTALAIGKAIADNPGATAMGVAATAHLAAARALTAAAAALGGRGAIPPVGGGPGKVGRLGRLVRGAGAVGAGLIVADMTVGVIKQLSDDNQAANLRHRKTISSQDLGLKWENPSDRDAIMKLAKEATDRFRRDPEGARGEAFMKLADDNKIKTAIGEGMASGAMKLEEGMKTAASAAADKLGEGMASGATKLQGGLEAGAATAGSIIASKITEAASNININVNTNTGGTNTGSNVKGGK